MPLLAAVTMATRSVVLIPVSLCVALDRCARRREETNAKFFILAVGKLHAGRRVAAAQRPARLHRRGPPSELPPRGRGAERHAERGGATGARAGAGAGRPA